MIGAVAVVALTFGNAAGLVVDVQVIEASNKAQAAGTPTKAIRDLGATLSYKSFRTVAHEQRTLALGDATQIFLPDGTIARISAVGVEEKRKHRTVRLRVRIEQGQETLDTEYSVRDGGTVFVSGGKNKASGSALVLAIAPHLR
jgi:hypothetical protein